MAFKVGAVVGEAVLKTDKWTSGSGVIQKSAKKLGGALVTAAKVGFVAISAALVKSTFEANKFQKAFSNVTTLISDTDENFQDISKSLLKLDSRLGTTTELTEGLYQALSAGAEDAAAGLIIVEQAAKFSGAALTDTATSVDVLTTAMNAYGSDVVSAAKASDIFFTTIKQGKITGEQLSGTIGQSIPLFASVGIKLEELSSGMAAMTKQGVSAAESTTQLNAIVNSFLKPSAAMTDTLKEMGFESGSAFLKAEGLTGALKLLEDQTGGDAAALAELVPNIRAMQGAMALTGKGGEEFTKILGEMENSAGSTEIAFAKQEKTFATFANELNKSQVIIGNISKVFVDELAVGAQTALESVNQFLLSSEGMKTFEAIAAKVGGAFNVIKTFGKEVFDLFKDDLFFAIDDIKAIFNDLFEDTMSAGNGFNLLAGAVDLVGAAFNIVIAYAKLVINYWLDIIKIGIEVAKVVGNLWDVITGKIKLSEAKAAFAAVGEAVKDMGVNLVDNAIGIVDEVKEQWSKLADGQKANGDKFAKAWDEGSKKSAAFVRHNYDKLVTGVENGNDAIAESTEETAEKTGKTVADTAKKTVEAVKSEIVTFNDWVQANLLTFADKFAFAFDTISEFASIAFGGIADISSQFFTNEQAKLENANNAENAALSEDRDTKEAALQNSLDQGLISQEQHDIQKIELDKSLAANEEAVKVKQLAKENELKKKQFENDKKLSTASVWLSAAAAIMGFWQAYAAIPFAGPIIAGSLTAAVTGLAIGQTASINKQEFVPAMAEGGTGAGLTQINENGGELQILKDGTKIVPNDISRDIAAASGGGGGDTIIFKDPVVRNDGDLNRIASLVDKILGKKLKT